MQPRMQAELSSVLGCLALIAFADTLEGLEIRHCSSHVHPQQATCVAGRDGTGCKRCTSG